MNLLTTKQLHLQAIDLLNKPAKTPKASAAKTSTPKQTAPKPPKPKSTPKLKQEGPMKSISIQHMSEVKPKNQNQLLYHVLSYLKDVEKGVTVEELSADVAGYDFNNPEISQQLLQSAKIQFEEGKYSYKPMYPVRNVNELLELINKTPNGIEVEQLKESYKALWDDLKKLEEQKEVVFIKHDESPPHNARYVVFPNYIHYRVSVSEEFMKEWKTLKPPHTVEVEKELSKAGIKTAEEEAQPFKRAAPKKKEPRKKKVSKPTNAHLANLDVTKAYTPPPKSQ